MIGGYGSKIAMLGESQACLHDMSWRTTSRSRLDQLRYPPQKLQRQRLPVLSKYFSIGVQEVHVDRARVREIIVMHGLMHEGEQEEQYAITG
jgi:hypothetical protein